MKAIQDLINNTKGGVLTIDPGTYAITSNLYIYGNLNIIGNGVTFLLDADLTSSDGIDYWINCGIQSKGGPKQTWSGIISGITFRTGTSAKCGRMLNIHRGMDCKIQDCVFDAGSIQTGAIGCYNNANWCNAPIKNQIRICDNRFIATQSAVSGSEAIGLGNAQNIWVRGNYIYGYGDDAIGLHTCSQVNVTDNDCSTPDGRIYLSGCQHAAVRSNRVARIPDTNGSWISVGSLIQSEIESASQQAPAFITISDNQLIHGAGITNFMYGIRIRGGRWIMVTNNTVYDSTGFGYGITWEGQVAPIGWSDSMDPDGKSRVYGLKIRDNLMAGGNKRPIISGLQTFPGYAVGVDIDAST